MSRGNRRSPTGWPRCARPSRWPRGASRCPRWAQARALLAKAGARAALGDATVVALAGATGSGKSTLFNALSGAEVSMPGVRRPTTGVAHATVWGEDGADRLLDWLEVPRRHRHEPEPALDGLVLLDLPDHDSVKLEHRLEVDRLVGLVDVLVWVLDPEKYADAAVHDRYLAPLAGHAGVLLVVLNQIDRLDAAAAKECLADLRALLDREGLGATPVLAVSARTGTGVAELRGELAHRVAARRAATDRLTADVRGAAAGLAAHCPEDDAAALGRRERTELVEDLGRRPRRRRRGARGDGGRRALGAARRRRPDRLAAGPLDAEAAPGPAGAAAPGRRAGPHLAAPGRRRGAGRGHHSGPAGP